MISLFFVLYIILPLLLLPLVLPRLLQARPVARVLLMADGPALDGAGLSTTRMGPQPAPSDSYIHCCVVDADGYYVEFVLVLLERDADGVIYHVQHYALNEGEQLVSGTPPSMRPYAGAVGLIRPRWSFDRRVWCEDADTAEIAAWEAEHPAPEASQAAPTAEEQLRADVDFLAAIQGVEL